MMAGPIAVMVALRLLSVKVVESSNVVLLLGGKV